MPAFQYSLSAELCKELKSVGIQCRAPCISCADIFDITNMLDMYTDIYPRAFSRSISQPKPDPSVDNIVATHANWDWDTQTGQRHPRPYSR